MNRDDLTTYLTEKFQDKIDPKLHVNLFPQKPLFTGNCLRTPVKQGFQKLNAHLGKNFSVAFFT